MQFHGSAVGTASCSVLLSTLATLGAVFFVLVAVAILATGLAASAAFFEVFVITCICSGSWYKRIKGILFNRSKSNL